MGNDLVKKVAGKEIIEHLKKDIQFYSTRDLKPNQVYLLLSKTEEYKEIDREVILLTIGQLLGEKYISQINIPKPKEEYSQQPEIQPYQPILNPNNITYEPENYEHINALEIKPFQESIQKPKKKKSKVGCIIGLTAFLALASVGGYFGYQKYQKDQRRQRQTLTEEKAVIGKTKQQEPKIPYIGPNNSNTCTLDINLTDYYEKANLELVLNSNGEFGVKIGDENRNLVPGENKIVLSNLQKGEYVLSQNGNEARYMPTRVKCSLTNPVTIKEGKKFLLQDNPIYVSELKEKFDGNIILNGDFNEQYLSELNSLLTGFSIKNKEGIFSFYIRNGQFNANLSGPLDSFSLSNLVFENSDTLYGLNLSWQKIKNNFGDTFEINIPNRKASLKIKYRDNILTEEDSYLKKNATLIKANSLEYIISSIDELNSNILRPDESSLSGEYSFKHLNPENKYMVEFNIRKVKTTRMYKNQVGEDFSFYKKIFLVPGAQKTIDLKTPSLKLVNFYDCPKETYEHTLNLLRESSNFLIDSGKDIVIKSNETYQKVINVDNKQVSFSFYFPGYNVSAKSSTWSGGNLKPYGVLHKNDIDEAIKFSLNLNNSRYAEKIYKYSGADISHSDVGQICKWKENDTAKAENLSLVYTTYAYLNFCVDHGLFGTKYNCSTWRAYLWWDLYQAKSPKVNVKIGSDYIFLDSNK